MPTLDRDPDRDPEFLRWLAPPPRWIEEIAADFAMLRERGEEATDDTYRRLARLLRGVEVDPMPAPRCQVLSRSAVRVAWGGPRTLRLTATERDVAVETDRPGMAYPGTVLAARAAFAWYRAGLPSRRRKDEP